MTDHVSINYPEIRYWDINENSTHYDKMMAAPTDYERRLMWIIWASIMYVVAVFALIVFFGILSSQKARKNPFNIYLLFLMVPDIFMSLACFITCALNAVVGHFYSSFACYFQSFYMVFGICANAWMNAIIAKELFYLLRGAKEGRAFDPPSKKKVIFDSLKVYIGSAFVASWGLIDRPWWPHKTGLLMGTACVPTDYDTASTIFFYCVYFPALMGLPLGYVIYVCRRIYKDNLMPREGQRRVLAIYFSRLTAVFVVMWLPALFFFFVVGAWVPHWAVWAGGAWSHLQGLVSAVMSLLKPDISYAVRQLICCRCSEEQETSNEKNGSTQGLSAENPSHSRWTSKMFSTAKQNHRQSGGTSNVTNGNADLPRSLHLDMSQLGTFSEVVGWKTHVEHVEEPEEARIPFGSMSQIGTFSEIVGWKSQIEPTEGCDEELAANQDKSDHESSQQNPSVDGGNNDVTCFSDKRMGLLSPNEESCKTEAQETEDTCESSLKHAMAENLDSSTKVECLNNDTPNEQSCIADETECFVDDYISLSGNRASLEI